MQNLISKKYRHLLWKDEIGDDFILLKYAEVYQYFGDVLRMLIWSPQKASQLRKMGVILNEDATDDGLCIVDVKAENLDQIIQLGAFKRRPNVNGKWLKDKESRLAHKIIPFNPNLEGGD